jgi:hypothetical protein
MEYCKGKYKKNIATDYTDFHGFLASILIVEICVIGGKKEKAKEYSHRLHGLPRIS